MRTRNESAVGRTRGVLGRALIIGVVGAAVVTGLAGCEGEFFQGPVAVRSIDGQLMVAVCTDITVVVLEAAHRDGDAGIFASRHTFWHAEGRMEFPSDAVFVVGSDGLPTSTWLQSYGQETVEPCVDRS